MSYKEAVADFDGIPAIVETSVLFDEIIAFDLVAGISGSIISTTDYDFMKRNMNLQKWYRYEYIYKFNSIFRFQIK